MARWGVLKKRVELPKGKGVLSTVVRENRFYPRISVHTQCELTRAAGQVLTCTLQDVSAGGAKIVVSQQSSATSSLSSSPLMGGEFVALTFTIGIMTTGSNHYQLQGTVVWVKSRLGRLVLGIEWDSAADYTINRLELEIARIIVHRQRHRGEENKHS